MQILPLNFFMYTVSGIWRPIECSSIGAKLLYNIFSFCIIMSLYFLVLTQFLDIALVVDNIDDFIINSLMFVSIITVCCKATVAIARRNAIISLVEMLLNEPHRPCNEDEIAIQTKFDRFIRSCSKKYSLLATSSLTGVTAKSVLNVMQGVLPYRVWLPYDLHTSVAFLVTSLHQIITLIFATIVNVGTETLVFGLLLQTCSQLEIFESRLHKYVIDRTAGYSGNFSAASLNEKEVMFAQCIRHHLSIYKYAKTVNQIFNQVFFFQFCGSILVLCTSVLYISKHVRESETVTLIAYTITMFVQIYVYCWSGNEVILKSESIGSTIYDMDWTSLSISDKKNLLMIMKRSKIPIKFTSSFLITLSLESYNNILKSSYSAFNLLQQS